MSTESPQPSSPPAPAPGWRSWIAERVPVEWRVFEQFAREPIPNHIKEWFYCLGGTPLILFLIMVVTGIMLTFYYVPSPDHAYESVRHVTEDVSFGWWIRGIHHWAANLMIFAVFLHMIRVFVTGAYRRPRELNWIVGCGLLGCTLAAGFTGYSLVYNQLSYWATTVGTNIAGETPLIGKYLLAFMRGGETVTSNTLTRFFTLHIGGLPTFMGILLVCHIAMIRIHGIATTDEQRPEPTADESSGTFPFFPDHFLTELAIALFVLTVLTSLTVIFPVHMGPPADPLTTPEHIKPEWYFYPAFRILKLLPLKAGIVFQGLAGAALVLWPFIDGAIRKRRPGSELGTWIGIIAILMVIGLTIWEALVL